MADAYTNQAATDLSQVVWSKALLFPLRDELYFDQVATSRSTSENMRGKSVTFTFPNDLALATTPIDEIISPDSVALSDATKNVTMQEYANTVRTTALARATGFVDVDQVAVNVVGFNAGASLDTVAATALSQSTNIQRANNRSANSGITATDTLTTKELEIAKTEFRKANVGKVNGMYWLFAHPYQILDLRLETGAGGWRTPREYGFGDQSNSELVTGLEGEWAGFNIISANREPMTADIGSGGTVDVYSAFAVGADALAKAFSDAPGFGPNPQVIFGLPVDALKRNHPISWYSLVGYKILRDAAVRKIQTAASRGAN